MGEIIRKDEAIDDIIADAHKTLTNAAAKGGAWKEIAEDRLTPIVLLLKKVEGDLEATTSKLAALEEEMDAFDGQVDDFLAAKADEMWNRVGRPGFDAAYSLVWPNGASTYTEGSNEEQPDRMDLLADWLDTGIHPKLDPAWGKAAAIEVRKVVVAYRQRLEPVTTARTKLKLLTKGKGVLARAAQTEIARLKKRYQSEGLPEAEISHVISERPRSRPEKPQDSVKVEPPKDAESA